MQLSLLRHVLLLLPLALLALPAPAIAQPDKLRVVTLGDSITRGVRPGVKADETFSAQLEKLLQARKVNAEVTNVGLGGERTDQALKRLDKAVLALKPQVVAIMYGHNDSHVPDGKKKTNLTEEEFRANLHALVKQVRQGGATPILMTPPSYAKQAGPNGVGDHHNVPLGKFAQVVREVAGETKAPLVEHFHHWAKKETGGVDLKDWTTDLYHPNPRGGREIAEVMLPAVLEALKK